MSAKRNDSGKDGKRGVPELPELSCRRHHRPTLLLANSPYLARTEGLGGRSKRNGARRTLITMDEEKSHGNLSGEDDEEGKKEGIRVELTCDESRRGILERKWRKGGER
jgi:hypothetical protein